MTQKELKNLERLIDLLILRDRLGDKWYSDYWPERGKLEAVREALLSTKIPVKVIKGEALPERGEDV